MNRILRNSRETVEARQLTHLRPEAMRDERTHCLVLAFYSVLRRVLHEPRPVHEITRRLGVAGFFYRSFWWRDVANSSTWMEPALVWQRVAEGTIEAGPTDAP
jgi:hypothetical protein